MLSTEIATNLRGRALEAVLIVELKRRGDELCYLRSESGREVDGLALMTDGRQLLVHVWASLADATTRELELISLLHLAAAGQVRWQPAIELLLNDPN